MPIVTKKQISEAVKAESVHAQEVANERNITMVVVSNQHSARRYGVYHQCAHHRPGIKVGDVYLYDGQEMTVQAVITPEKKDEEISNISPTRLNYLKKQLPEYTVKFPKTEADCKKVLAFERKNYGRSHYNNPILQNFIEDFQASAMMVISNGKVGQISRTCQINAKPTQPMLDDEEREARSFQARNQYSNPLTLDEARWLLKQSELLFHDAIGQALCKL